MYGGMALQEGVYGVARLPRARPGLFLTISNDDRRRKFPFSYPTFLWQLSNKQDAHCNSVEHLLNKHFADNGMERVMSYEL